MGFSISIACIYQEFLSLQTVQSSVKFFYVVLEDSLRPTSMVDYFFCGCNSFIGIEPSVFERNATNEIKEWDSVKSGVAKDSCTPQSIIEKMIP